MSGLNKVKKVSLIIVFLLVLFLSSCERPATRSLWSPLNTAGVGSTSTLADSVSPTVSAANIATTPAPKLSPTPVAIITLDLTTISQKYPLASKGYELLTWQKDGQWVFTLLAGTNRQKSFDEILAAGNEYSDSELIKVTVVGLENFKQLVNHLPKSEWITWGGMDLAGEIPAGTVYFSYPPDEMMDELIAYCKNQGITLVSLKKE
jgi:hypothetical protein